jgi:hypothetical protein
VSEQPRQGRAESSPQCRSRGTGGTPGTTHMLVLVTLILLALSACAPAWETTLVDAQGAAVTITRETLRDLSAFAADDGSVLLERVLYENGYRVIEALELITLDGQTRTYDWPTLAERAFWSIDGKLHLSTDTVQARRMTALPAELPVPLTTRLEDIAPTVSAVLGLPAPAASTGRALPLIADEEIHPRQVALIFLDGFGYIRYIEALHAGLIPNLAALDAPALGLAAYPPSTSVSSAVILTGAPPEVNGVVTRGMRATDTETFFDVAAAAGLRSVAVEGDALAFNLRNAEIILSGDRDGDGSTDDNVLANTLAVLAQGMPDVLWVHFHGIDDAGHTYGPDTPEERAKIVEVDAAVGVLLSALPPETVVLIFADHGMHTVTGSGRSGNHGQLIARDMLVPVWLFIR